MLGDRLRQGSRLRPSSPLLRISLRVTPFPGRQVVIEGRIGVLDCAEHIRAQWGPAVVAPMANRPAAAQDRLPAGEDRQEVVHLAAADRGASDVLAGHHCAGQYHRTRQLGHLAPESAPLPGLGQTGLLVHPPLIDGHVGVRDASGLQHAADVADVEAEVVRHPEGSRLVLVTVEDKPSFHLSPTRGAGYRVFTASLVSARTPLAVPAATGVGFLHSNLAAVQLGAVELLDSCQACLLAGEGDEGEAPRAPGLPVGGDVDLLQLAVGREYLAELVLGGIVGDSAHEQLGAHRLACFRASSVHHLALLGKLVPRGLAVLDLVHAVPTSNRLAWSRFEWDLGLSSAQGAGGRVHLAPGPAPSAAASRLRCPCTTG